MVANMQSYRTPGTPGQHIAKLKEEHMDKAISSEQQALYHSGVGMLLYLLKHSRPCLANPVRELAKALDGANMATYKELMRVIKFILDTKSYSLKVKPKIESKDQPWILTIFTNSNYAGNSDTHISVTGFCVFLLGIPVSWKSHVQKSVMLSSSEAEFVVLPEAAKEVKFVVQVLQSMGVEVKLPIIVQVDNVGAMFIAKNVTTSQHTKHIDLCYHYI